jgi:hypothetical protein
MDAFDVLREQVDEKVAQLKEHLSEGKATSFEEYKRLCGEIRGLLLARGYIIDLQQKMEYSDE